MSKRKAVISESECVACGSCVGICPCKAIYINHGITAKVINDKCVGCGKCSQMCPANIISIVDISI